jgi:heme exporter protein B
MGRAFKALVARELRLAIREGATLGTALGFYLVLVALMPLSLGPDLALLGRLAPGVLWVGLLLAALLSLPRLFETDKADGSLEVMAMAPLPLELFVVAKVLVHWLTVALPLVLITPILGLMLNLDFSLLAVLLGTMVLGTPAISAIGAMGAALTLEAKRGGVLVALLVLPLYIPTLIFGVTALSAVAASPDGATRPSLLLLAALSLVAVALSPFATAAALRTNLR